MAETVIDLDLNTPWEPPEPPEPGRRRRTRSVAALAVLAVTLGLLVAAAPPSRAGLLYHTGERQVRSVRAGGDRLYLSGARPDGTGPYVEARRPADGTVLWTTDMDPRQHLVVVTGSTLVYTADNDDHGWSSTVTLLDAATGRHLWQRPRVRLAGAVGGLLLVEDIRDAAPAELSQSGLDPGLNQAGEPREQHLLGLDQRTGSTVWEVTVPKGAVSGFSSRGSYSTGLVGLDELSPTGQLTRRDVLTGQVTGTRRLDWSGTAAMFTAEDNGRLVLYPDQQRGALVFDLDSGRQLFRWPGSPGNGLFRCTDTLLCTSDEDALEALDNRTGNTLWRLERYNMVIDHDGEDIVAGSYQSMNEQTGILGLVDGRTGTVTHDLGGWNSLQTSNRHLVWRPLEHGTAILGEFDPRTGRVALFGRAADWYGFPDCTVAGDVLACVAAGSLVAWRLP